MDIKKADGHKISNQDEFDLWAFVANLATIYIVFNGKRRKHGGLERKGERGKKTPKNSEMSP